MNNEKAVPCGTPIDLVDLGWANSGGEIYQRIQQVRAACRALKHEPTDIDIGPPGRGIEHVVTCLECAYVYRYDSSD